MTNKDDGKIRVRCTGCGKRVKFPKGMPGETYRCPICHHTIVSPLGGTSATLPSEAELRSSIHRPSPAAQPVQAMPRHQKIAGRNGDDETRLLQSIERLNAHLNRQNTTAAGLSRQVLSDETLSPDQQVAEIKKLRHAKAVSLREHVTAVLKDLERGIAALKRNPAAETGTIRERLAKLEKEKAGLTLYVKVMFALRTVGQDES